MCRFLLFVFVAAFVLLVRPAQAQMKEIPEPLKTWSGWATWNDIDRDSPRSYQSFDKPLRWWPSRMNLSVDAAGGRFDMEVTTYTTTWVPLPGAREVWPLVVLVDGVVVPVVEHDKAPSIQLAAGAHRIEGVYKWSQIPPGLKMPPEIGILNLTLEGKTIDAPTWDAAGFLWLKRDRPSETASKDFLAVKVYAVIEDGIPLWLRTKVELVVSGKSREEALGNILPTGWKLSSLQSPIPVAVDENGRAKAQVRAGKWTLQANAFQISNAKDIAYGSAAKPATKEQLIAFRPKPDFRMVEILGVPSIDVSQTAFPDEWRNLAVYRWDTALPIQIAERMRGMGLQKPAGLKITRQLWLDDSGRGLTFRDSIQGTLQQIWRLDAAPGQDLGSVRATDGEGQLITRNPQNGAAGFEIRQRDLRFDATGRIENADKLSASGWQADADALDVTLNLPPGWRLFALFGADWVAGDWLTAWTLLDLFLLLIFTLAVFRLWGIRAALLTFLAFGLSYHEPGAPRYVWLILLVPLALLRVVSAGWGKRVVEIGKWIAVAALVFVLVPFVARQVQQALYPQLENVSNRPVSSRTISAKMEQPEAETVSSAPIQEQLQNRDWSSYSSKARNSTSSNNLVKSNLAYDSKARIQTGPGVPEWTWRTVSYGWNGPVRVGQEVHPVLISLGVERALSILRIALLLALASVLLNARRLGGALFLRVAKPSAAVLLASFLIVSASVGHAQFPDDKTLETLRARLLEVPDVYPHAADIPSVSLTIAGSRLVLDAEIHAAIRTAVPLPGRLPVWSPVSVLVDGKSEAVLRRNDGYLWVVLEKGVHQVHVEGILPNATEWEWTFQLAPHQVKIDAPGWTVSGIKPDGAPEAQIFFSLQQKSTGGEMGYDRQDFQTLASVERHLELGLTWQLRTTVNRLTPTGKAVALRIPLLPGENVLSANLTPRDGFVEIRLGAQESSFTWESELPISPELALATRPDDTWVESWHLVASAVWNVAISGLEPTFEPGNGELAPVWRPWPGEKTSLAISRPKAITGQTVTVSRGTHEMTLGKRQRVSRLDLALRCSLGEDFLIGLPSDAEVTSLTLAGRPIPVRKEGSKIIVPLSPGEQNVVLGWKTNLPLGVRTVGEEIILPVESANLSSIIHLPADRWVLWANGPQRGPAVRFWGILVCSLLGAWVLGRLPLSPLRSLEWMLLALGLTQVPLPAAAIVVGWFFLLAWRGGDSVEKLPRVGFHLLQLLLVGLTVGALVVVIVVVGEGLLGNPEMFISGNGSSRNFLKWYQARAGETLPMPGAWSVSIWWYRFLMLLWALWLAASLIRWLQNAWQHFSRGGIVRRKVKLPVAAAVPPPMPVAPVVPPTEAATRKRRKSPPPL